MLSLGFGCGPLPVGVTGLVGNVSTLPSLFWFLRFFRLSAFFFELRCWELLAGGILLRYAVNRFIVSLIVLDMAVIAVCHSGGGPCGTLLPVLVCGEPRFSTASRSDLADDTTDDSDSEDMVGDGVLEYIWWALAGDVASDCPWAWGVSLPVDLSTCAYVTLAGLLVAGSRICGGSLGVLLWHCRSASWVSCGSLS